MKRKILPHLLVILFYYCLVEVWSICPLLEVNSNVVVICSNGQSAGGRKLFKCNSKDTTNSERIETGTIAIYQCDKHYKPTSRRLNGGRLQCGENGVWTNYAAFKKFQCELECGKRPAFHNQLISSGNDTNAHNWPWVATIYRQVSQGEYKYSCGGSLIGLRTILTAAHCVADQFLNKYPKDKLRVALGSVSSDFGVNIRDGASVHLVEDILIHPDYLPETLGSDIAIIQLSKAVDLADSIFPVCLPLSFEHDALILSTGNTGEIASFGVDGTGFAALTLQYAQISILSTSHCNKEVKIIPRSEQFCAGNPKGPNICRGDSGSGLVFKSSELHDNSYVIHGIVSNTGELSNGCAPFVLFAKVYTHIRWIQENLLGTESEEETVTNFQMPNNNPPKKTTRPGISNNNNEGVIRKPTNGSRICNEFQGTLPSTLSIPNKNQSSLSGCSNQNNNLGEEYSLAEKPALVLLRPLVKNILLEDFMEDDAYLIKFLRTKNLNLKETTEMLKTTMEWRKENRMNEITREDFSFYRKQYTVFFQGYDKEGRPVYATVVRLIDTKKMIETGEIEKFKRYAARNLEKTDEIIRGLGRKNITQGIVIFDMAGIDRKKHLCFQCLQLTRHLVRVYETYYPQQNYITYVINLPDIAAQALDTIRPLMSEYTTRTVKMFGPNKDEWSKELLKQIPRDQLFRLYGGTKVVKPGTERIQLAL